MSEVSGLCCVGGTDSSVWGRPWMGLLCSCHVYGSTTQTRPVVALRSGATSYVGRCLYRVQNYLFWCQCLHVLMCMSISPFDCVQCAALLTPPPPSPLPLPLLPLSPSPSFPSPPLPPSPLPLPLLPLSPSPSFPSPPPPPPLPLSLLLLPLPLPLPPSLCDYAVSMPLFMPRTNSMTCVCLREQTTCGDLYCSMPQAHQTDMKGTLFIGVCMYF